MGEFYGENAYAAYTAPHDCEITLEFLFPSDGGKPCLEDVGVFHAPLTAVCVRVTLTLQLLRTS